MLSTNREIRSRLAQLALDDTVHVINVACCCRDAVAAAPRGLAPSVNGVIKPRGQSALARAVVPPPRLRISSLTFDAMDAMAPSLARLRAERDFYEVAHDAD